MMKKGYIFFTVLLLISGVLYFLQANKIFSPYSLLDKINPFVKKTYNLTSLKRESVNPATEVEVLKSKIKNLEEENKNLRLLLQAPLPGNWGFIPANVIGNSRFLIVDKGEKDQVKRGDAVVFQEVFVGKVLEVTPSSAKIILPTDPESKIAVKTENNVRGILIGRLGKEMSLEQVLQKEGLKNGEKILTSDESLPANILIGKVKTVAIDEREPFKRAEIEPFFSYSSLWQVFIIRQ